MSRAILSGLALCLTAGFGWAQLHDPPPESRTILGGGNELLSAGADAIRVGQYDEGIRLTTLGLEHPMTRDQDRAAALSNLCAAYAAKGMPDAAIRSCTESLALNGQNWRAFSNRSYAYWLKGQFAEATFDLDAAAAINPVARQVAQIRGMINERSLQPRITLEEHQ